MKGLVLVTVAALTLATLTLLYELENPSGASYVASLGPQQDAASYSASIGVV